MKPKKQKMTKSEGGKKGATIRWGGKRPPTAQIRIRKTTADEMRKKIPEKYRLDFADQAIATALHN